jgi:hypothetical protein
MVRIFFILYLVIKTESKRYTSPASLKLRRVFSSHENKSGPMREASARVGEGYLIEQVGRGERENFFRLTAVYLVMYTNTSTMTTVESFGTSPVQCWCRLSASRRPKVRRRHTATTRLRDLRPVDWKHREITQAESVREYNMPLYKKQGSCRPVGRSIITP